MINVSNDFKNAMKTRRDFKTYAEVTFPNGKELTLDSSQFMTGSNGLTDGAGISSFPIGEAIQKVLQLEILNDAEQYRDYDFVGAKIRLYTDFQVNEVDPFAGRNLLVNSDFKIEYAKDTNTMQSISDGTVFIPQTYDLQSLIGKTICFSYYVENIGERVSFSGIPSYGTNRFGMHLQIRWRDSTGTLSDSIMYPLSAYLTSEDLNGRVSQTMELTPPNGYDTLEELIVSVQAYAKPAGNNDAVWKLGYPKIEIGEIDTGYSIAPEDVRTERIEKGTYTVITPETYGETIIITAYDDMYKADKDYATVFPFPQTAGELLRNICSACGIHLGSTSFLHDDFIIQSRPTGKFREIIGYIAMIACGNARIDTLNRLQIITYDFSDWDSENKYHLLNEFSSPKIEFNDTVITGFKTTIQSDTGESTEISVGTDTYVIAVKNPLISGREKTVLTWLEEVICNVPFRPFSGDAISTPLIEFMDLGKVQDRRGNLYNTFVTDVNFLMPGYTTIKNSTPSMSRSAFDYATEASKVEQRARDLVEKEKTDREAAIQQLGEVLKNSSGMYSTDVIQPDGSSVRYLHDKRTLEESKNIIKITSNAIGFSIDGGKTYPYGQTLDGETITRLLYAEGINADYIKTGSFSAQQEAFINPSYDNALLALQFASNIQTPTPEQIVLYDFNVNGSVDVADATIAMQLANGFITIDEIVAQYGYTPQKSMVFVKIDPSNPEKAVSITAPETVWEHKIEIYIGVNGFKISNVICDTVYTENVIADSVNTKRMVFNPSSSGTPLTYISVNPDLIIGREMRTEGYNTEIHGDTLTCHGGSGGLRCNSNWQLTSDIRLKDDIEDMPGELVEIWKNIQPKSFVWGEKSGIYDPQNPKKQFGILAQDVIVAFKKSGIDISKYAILSENGQYYSVTYDHYHMLTAIALKSTINQIETLETRIKKLEDIILPRG